MLTRRLVSAGLLTAGMGLGGPTALAQSRAGADLPSGFTAPGLPFGPTSTVGTVAAPTPTMAIANPGGLSFGGASGGSAAPVGRNAGGLSFGGAAGFNRTPGGASIGGASAATGGGSAGAGGIGSAPRRPLDDVTGRIGAGGGGGAPAGAGIAGAGASRRPTDAYFDPLAGSGFR